ncbi:MAG: PsiF repeat-containing protein [Burkholderiales bacterium]|nr:PsiF repeat-containing protein [Burkholderiales bacterium]
MKKMIALVCLGLATAVSTPAFAGAQQEKMKACNVEAKGMKGQERKDFMKKCLKKDYVLKSAASSEKKAESAAKPSQKEKMKSCNAEAKSKKLKGDDRKKFMSTCLKG